MTGFPDTPGAYVQRDDRAAAAARGAGVAALRTDIAGFCGIAERGPVGAPVLVETMRQFESAFGGYTGAGFLAYAMRAFFENGGRACRVVRVAAEAGPALPAGRDIADASGAFALRIEASSPGTWGDALTVALNPAWRAETWCAAPPLAAEALPVASVEGFVAGALLRLSQPGAPDRFRVLAGVDPAALLLRFTAADPALRRPTDAPLSGLLPGRPLRIERLDYDLVVREGGRLAAVVQGLSLVPGTPRFIGDVLAPPAPDAEGRLPARAAPVSVLVAERAADAVPLPLDVPPGLPLALAGGRDGLALLSPTDFIAALAALEPLRDVSILAAPDILVRPVRVIRRVIPLPAPDPCAPCPASAPAATPLPPPEPELPPIFDAGAVQQVQAAMLAQCERLRDRVALIDPPFAAAAEARAGIGPVQAWRGRFDSAFGAMYFPWVAVPDPLGAAPARLIPPCGHAAGQLAATDLAVGPHKAAANAPLAWALDASLAVDPPSHGLLNALGVNVLAARDGRSLRILGARTLSSDPDARHLPVRRLLCMLRRALDAATQWAVFEPNSAETRALLVQSIGAFLRSLWRGGALAGAVPEAAWRLRCDEANNPGLGRGRGELVVEIAIAPAVPFEFVLLRLGRSDQAFELAEQGFARARLAGAA